MSIGSMRNGDNTSTMKAERAYQRLIKAILQKMPSSIIIAYLKEAKDIAMEGMEKHLTFENALLDSRKYLLYYQCGSCILVLKDSPLGKQIMFGNKKKKKEDKKD